MNKNIVCGGCSYTQGDLYDFKTWPEFLGRILDLPVVNLGRAGKSNGWIAQNLFNYIIKHHYEIDSVFVLWTDFWRHDMFNHDMHSTPLQTLFQDDYTVPKNLEEFLSGENKYRQIGKKFVNMTTDMSLEEVDDYLGGTLSQLQSWDHTIKRRHKGKDPKQILKNVYSNNFYYMKTVEVICESFNIPYTSWIALTGQGSMIRHCFDAHITMSYAMRRSVPILEHIWDEAENYLNIKNCVNWPWSWWKGNDVKNAIVKKDLKYSVSEMDNHPSELGHELITKAFFDHYVENNFNESPKYIYE